MQPNPPGYRIETAEPRTMRTGRPGVVAIVAAIAALVLTVALGNPSVSDAIARHAVGRETFKDDVLTSLTAVAWRFSSAQARIGWAMVAADVVFILLVLLLVAVVVRGHGTFWPSFVGTWVCVVVALLVSRYVFVAIVKHDRIPTGRLTYIVFRGQTGLSFVLFAGLMFGLVIGLVAGLTAVASRRSETVVDPGTVSAAPTGDGPGFAPGGYPSPAPYPAAPYSAAPPPVSNPTPWSRPDDPERTDGNPTTAIPTASAPSERGPHETAVLPAVGDDAPTTTSADDDADHSAHTAQLPRVEDERRE